MLPIVATSADAIRDIKKNVANFYKIFLERFDTVTSFWEKPATRIMKAFSFEGRF